MKRITTLTAAVAIALASGAALADGGGDNSMSRWTGESHAAFEAARTMSGSAAAERVLTVSAESSMSRWNGESYVAFETARLEAIGEPRSAFAEARDHAPHRLAVVHAPRGRTSTDPFSDRTAG
jgi:hypothetical protein